MPAFTLSDSDFNAIVAFIHDQKVKAEAVSGGRRGVEPEDLRTGDAEAGRKYFNGEGSCSKCHSATGDLAGISNRFRGLALLQRMLNPPRSALPKSTVTTASGEIVTGALASRDEFTITFTDTTGAMRTWAVGDIKFTLDDPVSAHFEQLGKYTDEAMHNVYAYLETLR